MKLFAFLGIASKQILRKPGRSFVTMGGIAVAVFIFATQRAIEVGLNDATRPGPEDRTLVVYRENRFCPFTSRLPQYYERRIEALDGVESVTPMKILVSNCRASLDVVTFRGVPQEDDTALSALNVISGRTEDWRRRSDAALVGESLAERRGIRVGDRFSAAGITVHVAAIFRSDEPQHQNVAYTPLPFLQEASRKGGTGGIVTQFNVVIRDPQRAETIAQAIDDEFANDPDPTHTRLEKAFVADAANDVVRIVGFSSLVGWAALIAVFALVASAISISVRDRVREHAVFQTLGFTGRRIAALVVAESTTLGVAGGLVGATSSFLVLRYQRLSFFAEGLNVEVRPNVDAVISGVIAAVLVGAIAGLTPAWRAARVDIANAFRAV